MMSLTVLTGIKSHGNFYIACNFHIIVIINQNPALVKQNVKERRGPENCIGALVLTLLPGSEAFTGLTNGGV